MIHVHIVHNKSSITIYSSNFCLVIRAFKIYFPLIVKNLVSVYMTSHFFINFILKYFMLLDVTINVVTLNFIFQWFIASIHRIDFAYWSCFLFARTLSCHLFLTFKSACPLPFLPYCTRWTDFQYNVE